MICGARAAEMFSSRVFRIAGATSHLRVISTPAHSRLDVTCRRLWTTGPDFGSDIDLYKRQPRRGMRPYAETISRNDRIAQLGAVFTRKVEISIFQGCRKPLKFPVPARTNGRAVDIGR